MMYTDLFGEINKELNYPLKVIKWPWRMAARNAYFPLFIILNRWKIKGRPFDSEGGGGGGRLANFVGTDYLFSSRAGPDYLFAGIPRTEYLFSITSTTTKI